MMIGTLLGLLLIFTSMDLDPPTISKQTTVAYQHQWTNGVSNDPSFFPIAVWLQSPRNAPRYRRAGFNLYVGLWKGPTEDQLKSLSSAGMQAICAQNKVGLTSANRDVIVGWMQGDEPDNAQARRGGNGYDPPIVPAKVIARYQRMRQQDDTRPILLNLGQGVAFDDYIGRGVRRNHPEDYVEYCKGCDIASFDIYPVVHRNKQVAGKLEYVPKGVKRLRQWTSDKKIVWNCIECSRISNTTIKPTPEQVRSEVWMSLIHGSRGLIYFVHQFKPSFKEASLLDDPDLLPAVTAINKQILALAPVLNSPTVTGTVQIHDQAKGDEIAAISKVHEGTHYLFAVNMKNHKITKTFEFLDGDVHNKVDVLYEDRFILTNHGRFQDNYEPYEVHLYSATKKDGTVGHTPESGEQK